MRHLHFHRCYSQTVSGVVCNVSWHVSTILSDWRSTLRQCAFLHPSNPVKLIFFEQTTDPHSLYISIRSFSFMGVVDQMSSGHTNGGSHCFPSCYGRDWSWYRGHLRWIVCWSKHQFHYGSYSYRSKAEEPFYEAPFWGLPSTASVCSGYQ